MVIDMVGRTYGRLTVTSRATNTRTGQARWVATCTCGNTTTVSGPLLRKGHTKSCGCLHKDVISTHGRYKTRTYRLWGAMHQRCRKHPHYSGITVCAEWAAFEAFLRDMGECPDGMTLDRLDNTRGYEPDNCRWATMREQVRNRLCNKLDADKAAAIRSDFRPTSELAKVYGVHAVTIRAVRRGSIWA